MVSRHSSTLTLLSLLSLGESQPGSAGKSIKVSSASALSTPSEHSRVAVTKQASDGSDSSSPDAVAVARTSRPPYRPPNEPKLLLDHTPAALATAVPRWIMLNFTLTLASSSLVPVIVLWPELIGQSSSGFSVRTAPCGTIAASAK